MSQRSGRLPRSRRLRESRDFKRVSRYGDRVSSGHFVLLATTTMPPGVSVSGEARGSALSGLRLGVTVSRAVGNAVTRNRVKRQIRAWFRGFSSDYPEYPGFLMDLVVIARKSGSSLQSDVVVTHLNKLASDSLKSSGHLRHAS